MPHQITDKSLANLRELISKHHLSDESECVRKLLVMNRWDDARDQRIQKRARDLVQQVRQNSTSRGGVNSFMQQYDLSSHEGIVLMCLAESLLRTPDVETINLLIKDKLLQANWEQYIGKSDSVFVNASTWGLMLTGKLVGLDDHDSSVSGAINKLVTRLGEPVIRAAISEAMRILGQQFIMGATIENALERSKRKDYSAFCFSYDMLGEAALCRDDANYYRQAYLDAISNIAIQYGVEGDLYQRPSISIKLSALHPRFEYTQREKVLFELLPDVIEICKQASLANICVTIDGEEADRLDLTLDVVESLCKHQELQNWDGLGVVVQAYQKRAIYVVDWLQQLAIQHHRRICVRLVKGAYWDSEIKRAQELGLESYPVFTRKEYTDVSYLVCAQLLLKQQNLFYLQFATHNAHTATAILDLADEQCMELQRLHGMGEELYDALLQYYPSSLRCRVYAPVGTHKELLPYLVRRLLENGANTSFVNRINDAKADVVSVVSSPVGKVVNSDKLPHKKIPLPKHLFGNVRINSSGISLDDGRSVKYLILQLNLWKIHQWKAHSIVMCSKALRDGSGEKTVYEKEVPIKIVSPTNKNKTVGYVSYADKTLVQDALQSAQHYHAIWSEISVEKRAECLILTAQLIEDNRIELVSLLAQEAGRTIPDALAEIREAVDFCRYYAELAKQVIASGAKLPGPTGEENYLYWQGRGVFVCISPWNFPIAIFCGQIAAALVSGNTVIAKPASYTPLTAFRITQLMHQAGIPLSALQLLIGKGNRLGDMLVDDQRVAGIAFTGSTQTAQHINQRIAQRSTAIIPFIAETGGQNAMIVDSSALPQQVVMDVLYSAFNSAGQRCSALRVLFLQDDVAEEIIRLLGAAMRELVIDDPQQLSSDVGPVINQLAKEKLLKHIAYMKKNAQLICQISLPKHLDKGSFVAPCAFELSSLSLLKEEVFGPVLHVIRYQSSELEKIIDEINNTQYGLTLGIHTRIEAKARYIRKRVRVGNIYINRNMIGAAVGVQPFGGEGLSGTGPKAGGPNYLYRFCTERVVTSNITAIGGNTGLLSLS